jgi:hypothetical protein
MLAAPSPFWRFLHGPVFAYLLIALVQLKVVWGMWDFKDIDWGDTICYYSNACETLDRARINIIWSPIFAFFGSLVLHVSHDPYFYCIATRIICALAVSLLTLAVMRRLLPPGIAWFVAAWWAVLPTNFNTLYQIHLFGTIPILVSWLVLSRHTRWRRAVALAILIGSGLLIRNEHLACAAVLAGCISFFEFSNWRHDRQPIWPIIKPYTAALLVVASLVLVCYVRSTIKYPALSAEMRYRHTNNVGQIFASGFCQRYPGVWRKDQWTEYGDLMTKYFGQPEMSFLEAVSKNPAAMAEHVVWNASLVPSGIQFLLFNRIGEDRTPDYIRPPVDFCGATVLSALVIAYIFFGMLKAVAEKEETKDWLKLHRWTLTAMASYVPVAFVLMLMQRPRAAYVFPLGIELMGLVGFAVWRLYSYKELPELAQKACPVAMILLFLAVSPYYSPGPLGRLLLHYVRILEPFAIIIEHDAGKTMVPRYSHEIAYYLFGTSGPRCERSFITVDDIPEMKEPRADVEGILRRNQIRDVLFDQPTAEGPSSAEKALAASVQWKLLALRRLPDRTLSLYSVSDLYRPQSYPGR